MTYQFRNERGVMKIYDTKAHNLYWLDKPKDVIAIVALLNEKAAQQLRAVDASPREAQADELQPPAQVS